ncbi:unnamed protein product [Schistocephalus solidus]|uniref:Flocculation protein FLO11-like n=1 Tax=Schistocephalus solidus TaxID=70667 RepID=A0A183TN97_SCHSO|nr:unnamed protein product [Schistocephalus solidus]
MSVWILVRNFQRVSESSILRGFGDSMDEGASASTLSASSSSGLAATFISDVKYVIGLLRSSSLSLPAPSMDNMPTSLCGVRSDLHWVHCLLPVANAGLCQVIGTASQPANSTGTRRFCVPLVRSQVRGIMLSPDLISCKPEACQRFLNLLHLPRPSFHPLPEVYFSVTQEPLSKPPPPPISPLAIAGLTNGGTVNSLSNTVSISKGESSLPLSPAEVFSVSPPTEGTKVTIQTTSANASSKVDSGNADNEDEDGDAATFLSSQIETDPVSPQLQPPQVASTEVVDKASPGAYTERDACPISSSPRGALLNSPLSELKVTTSSNGALTNASPQLISDDTRLDAATLVSTTLGMHFERLFHCSSSLILCVHEHQFDFQKARSPSSSASTFNFIYGPAGREFPWDQFLSLPPADRGLIKQLRIQVSSFWRVAVIFLSARLIGCGFS